MDVDLMQQLWERACLLEVPWFSAAAVVLYYSSIYKYKHRYEYISEANILRIGY